MRGLLWAGAVGAISAAFLAAWIVIHGLTDHGQLDKFHLVVALGSAAVGLMFLYQLRRRRAI